MNGEAVLRVEYDAERHAETVYDHQHNELLLLDYNAAGRLIRVVPRTHLDALNVTYDRHGRWTRWTRGELSVTRVYDDVTGRLMERRLGDKTRYRYGYRNTSKARRHSATIATATVIRQTLNNSDVVRVIGDIVSRPVLVPRS